MRVLWADAAKRQLHAIHDYVAQTSPDYAVRLLDCLTKRSIQIALFPFSGRMVPEYELNEIRELIEGSYRIIYRIREDWIDLVTICHGSRLLPPTLDE